MKKIISVCLLLLCSFCLYAQDCNLRLQTARDYKSQGDYQTAVKWYENVFKDCGDYDGNVSNELEECRRKLTESMSAFSLKSPGLTCTGSNGTFVMELGSRSMEGKRNTGLVASAGSERGGKKSHFSGDCQSTCGGKNR